MSIWLADNKERTAIEGPQNSRNSLTGYVMPRMSPTKLRGRGVVDGGTRVLCLVANLDTRVEINTKLVIAQCHVQK
jgi:hypothetical protein